MMDSSLVQKDVLFLIQANLSKWDVTNIASLESWN